MAKCDEFGFGIENTRAITRVFASPDKGKSWRPLSVVNGSFWSSIFTHRGALYLLGVDKQYGRVVIHRSQDGGRTWTTPTDASNGVLRADGKFHCAPMPVIEHQGRLWRAMEDAGGPGGWGSHFRAFMMSAPLDADLLRAESWTSSNPLQRDATWNNGDFGGWLEGNAVVTPDGKIVDVLRADTRSPDEKAAVVSISGDGKTSSFDPQSSFIAFPGGAKKFTIRFDARSKLYWSLANIVAPRHRREFPGSIRNTLALTSSPDLKVWTVRSIVLYHPDVARHGFQYVDWLFEKKDIIFVSRTAYEDGLGGAPNNHDANFLTFHRLKNFRALTIADSVPMPEQAQMRLEPRDFIISGHGFEPGALTDGARAFSNRDYLWRDVPARFRGGRFTRTGGGEAAHRRRRSRAQAAEKPRTGGGEAAQITVKAKRRAVSSGCGRRTAMPICVSVTPGSGRAVGGSGKRRSFKRWPLFFMRRYAALLSSPRLVSSLRQSYHCGRAPKPNKRLCSGVSSAATSGDRLRG